MMGYILGHWTIIFITLILYIVKIRTLSVYTVFTLVLSLKVFYGGDASDMLNTFNGMHIKFLTV